MNFSHLRKSQGVIPLIGAALVWGCSGPAEPQQDDLSSSSYVSGSSAPPATEGEAAQPAAAADDPSPAAKMLNLTGTAGYASLVNAFDRLDVYPWTKGNPKSLFFTRELDGEEGLGVSWLTAPWSGKSSHPIIFPASFEGTNLKVRLTLAGKTLIEFKPTDTDEVQQWDEKGTKLEFHKIGVWQGVHGVFVLELDEDAAKVGQALELGLKILEADDEKSWIGIRDAKNGLDF